MAKKSVSGLEADIYNLKGEVVEKISLPKEIFAVGANPKLVAQAVRVYQANQRLGTHSTKTRANVAGSTRKIYRQKGTGRARHGAITAPIFVGGGVAHGPHPKDYSLEMPKKMKRLALLSVLSDKFKSKALKVVRGLEKIETKTKKMARVLASLKLKSNGKKEKTLLIMPADFKNVILAGRNIESLTLENARRLNTYEVLSHDCLLFMEESIPVLTSHFGSRKKETRDIIGVKDKLKTANKKQNKKTIPAKIRARKKS